MSTAHLLNTCPACGAEESLDALLLRMIDDDQVRRLIADVVTRSLPVGGLVVRYLRLHKPAAQKLRMTRVAQVLGELVPDMQRGVITRKGREWAAPLDNWRTALQAVFDAVEAGTLRTPLPGNAYLYEVLMRQADKAEGATEREQIAATRDRTPIQATPATVGDVITQAFATGMAAPQPLHGFNCQGQVVLQHPPPGTSPTVRAMRAEIERKTRRAELAEAAVGPGGPVATPLSSSLSNPLKGASHDL